MEMKTTWDPRSEGHPESVADFSRADSGVECVVPFSMAASDGWCTLGRSHQRTWTVFGGNGFGAGNLGQWCDRGAIHWNRGSVISAEL